MLSWIVLSRLRFWVRTALEGWLILEGSVQEILSDFAHNAEAAWPWLSVCLDSAQTISDVFSLNPPLSQIECFDGRIDKSSTFYPDKKTHHVVNFYYDHNGTEVKRVCVESVMGSHFSFRPFLSSCLFFFSSSGSPYSRRDDLLGCGVSSDSPWQQPQNASHKIRF